MIKILDDLGKGWYRCDDGRGDVQERHETCLTTEEIEAFKGKALNIGSAFHKILEDSI